MASGQKIISVITIVITHYMEMKRKISTQQPTDTTSLQTPLRKLLWQRFNKLLDQTSNFLK